MSKKNKNKLVLLILVKLPAYNILKTRYNFTAPKTERMMGIGPTPPAWKAGALPLSYIRDIWREQDLNLRRHKSADLQSAAIDRSAISPVWNNLS